MKKLFLVFVILILVFIIIFSYNYRINENVRNEVLKYNQEFEKYNDTSLNGLDITTVINKAISNNEKYNINKDKNGYYILDNENSIEIYVTMIINDTTYKMERINEVGMSTFTYGFGQVEFKCSEVTYHPNGKIATMTFESMDY